MPHYQLPQKVEQKAGCTQFVSACVDGAAEFTAQRVLRSDVFDGNLNRSSIRR